MYEWVALLLIVALLVFPWIVRPVHRVLKTENVGWVYERLVLGFFFPLTNLSNRLNQLERKKVKLDTELKKVVKNIEDEKKHLDSKVAVIEKDYQHHLVDYGDKRDWRYLFRKVPIPTVKVVKQVEKDRTEAKDERRATYFTLEGSDLPPGFVVERDKHRAVKKYVFHDNSHNQQQSQSRKNKGNNQQQQQQQNNQ